MKNAILESQRLKARIDFPNFIKYMGSKSSLIHNLTLAIDSIYQGEIVCDLFAGSATLSGALSNSATLVSNDIQAYSSVLAQTYFSDYSNCDIEKEITKILKKADDIILKFKRQFPELAFNYSSSISLKEFQDLEKEQQNLIDYEFGDKKYNLFVKCYSGTYWSFSQCLWIDALRQVADSYTDSPIRNAILSSLMFAMPYNAQSTGHYAQYRDANNIKSMNDILIYRRKEIKPYFIRKMLEVATLKSTAGFEHKAYTMNYLDCIKLLPKGSIIYADPPYAFVHYSRFYHALETLVKYDYPELKFKGRYRVDRHQSPFCKRSEVVDAFRDLFVEASKRDCKIILSYSNTGMISLDEIIDLAKVCYGDHYLVKSTGVDYLHSTMGRKNDKSREVKEYLVTVRPIMIADD